VAANLGGLGANVPARPVRLFQPGYVSPMTTGCEHVRCARGRWSDPRWPAASRTVPSSTGLKRRTSRC